MPDVREVTARALAAAGAAVEPVEPDALDVLASPPVQEALGIGEFERLAFGPEAAGGRRVSIEAGFLDSLVTMLADRGRMLTMTVTERGSHWPTSPEQFLPHGVVLENATYRFRAADTMARARYLLLVLHLTAISDERREDVFSLCVNETNGAGADHLVTPALELLHRMPGEQCGEPFVEGLPAPWSSDQVQQWCSGRIPGRVRERVTPFLSGMRRRMHADLERLWTYYSGLRAEAASRMERDKARGAAPDREALRIDAIEREYRMKTEELDARYGMRVTLEVVQALRIIIPVCRVEFDILRRKGKRAYHLDWNPLSRRLDTLPCEGCGAVAPVHVVCDDRLHLLCRNCLSPCPRCGKEYCRACHSKACPRC